MKYLAEREILPGLSSPGAELDLGLLLSWAGKHLYLLTYIYNKCLTSCNHGGENMTIASQTSCAGCVS